MQRHRVARNLIRLVLVGALGGAIGAWRYYRVPADLRSAQADGWWQALPWAAVALLAVAVWLALPVVQSEAAQRDDAA